MDGLRVAVLDRWMNKVIIQIARVATACQLNVSRSNRNQNTP
jgi:hypothetical protein